MVATVRKERLHHAGRSNRTAGVTIHSVCADTGCLDFDTTTRSAVPSGMSHRLDTQVPISTEGQGNQDFSPKLPGHTYRQPKSDPGETKRLTMELRERKEATLQFEADKPSTTLQARDRYGGSDPIIRETRQKGLKVAPRWNPARWHSAPHWEQGPLRKEEGQAWNHNDSEQERTVMKGQDRLMRSVRRPEDVDTPRSDADDADLRHPTVFDKDEYYPGRGAIDGSAQEAGNDFQIRPINLPDFANPPAPGADPVNRMQRLREVVKQRYAGRPRLMGVFRNCCLRKPGFAFPKDLQQVFDQIGIKVTEDECKLLVQSCDKDAKGAVNFAEFADLILGPEVDVGGSTYQAQDRHVRHMTKTLVENIVGQGQNLGKAFCELDPERKYKVSKNQFGNALGTACNHISKQAVDFLWAAMFPDEHGADIENRTVDWRDFMDQVAHYAHENRPPTPVCLQPRKRQYDLLQRTYPITKGQVGEVDLHRPHQDASDEVVIVADRLLPRPKGLLSKPRECGMLAEPFLEDIRMKALRVERALPHQVPKKRLEELLKNRDMVHQDELTDLIVRELKDPRLQGSLGRQSELWASTPDIMSLETAAQKEERRASASPQPRMKQASKSDGFPGRVALKLVPADVHSYVATQRTNKHHEVNVQEFLDNLYRPENERKTIHYVNDGLNKALRGHPPPRERPPNSVVPRHENHWQARFVMEQLGDSISQVECKNGGRLMASKMFKRIDMDNDGYISLSDLKQACEKFKVPHTSADLHAFFSEIDKDDKGSVDIGDFTRNYVLQTGSLLDSMSRPIRGTYHEGGVEFGGPVQEKLDRQEREVAARHAANTAAFEASQSRSLSDTTSHRAPSSSPASIRSRMSQTGASITSSQPGSPAIYEHQVGLITGKARVSDVIRARCTAWKPDKSELFTSSPKTRFGMTVYPDTRHVTEHDVPLSSAWMSELDRFKTMNSMNCPFASPDKHSPQQEDALRKHARNEFRVETIRQRQRDMAERAFEANETRQRNDEMNIARKALNQFNYERKCRMACA